MRAHGPGRAGAQSRRTEIEMIILGVILLILGFVFSIPILWTIGLILVAVGVVLMILGATGRAIAGRRYWY
jgi:predicted acyltransferase